MFNLRDVLELVNKRLENGTLTEDELIHKRHQFVLHVTPQFGDEMQALFKELLIQRLGKITFVAKKLASQGFNQVGDSCTVIDIARGEAAGT